MNMHRLVALIGLAGILIAALALQDSVQVHAYVRAGPLEVRFNSEPPACDVARVTE